jgi:adenylosuccinate synthase
MKGWISNISVIRKYDKLPILARQYIRRLEQLIVVPIKWVSVGPERDAMIKR